MLVMPARVMARLRSAKRTMLPSVLSYYALMISSWTVVGGELFFDHMRSCVDSQLRTALKTDSEKQALADWTKGIKGDGVYTKGKGNPDEFTRVLQTSLDYVKSEKRLLQSWNRCVKEVCVPNTELQTIHCRSLYFSYNPRRAKCVKQRGFCRRSVQHFRKREHCEAACVESSGRAAEQQASMPRRWIKMALLESNPSSANGTVQEILNKNFVLSDQRSFWLLGYFWPPNF